MKPFLGRRASPRKSHIFLLVLVIVVVAALWPGFYLLQMDKCLGDCTAEQETQTPETPPGLVFVKKDVRFKERAPWRIPAHKPTPTRKATPRDQKQDVKEEVRHVLIVQTMFDGIYADKKHGGPAGELHQYATLVDGLKSIGFAVTFLTSDQKVESHFSSQKSGFDEYEYIITDRFSFPVLVRLGDLAAHFCRYRFLDFWGAPLDDALAPFRPIGLGGLTPSHAQFLVPYPLPEHTFLPYIVRFPAQVSNENERLGGLVWGKEASYWASHFKVLDEVSKQYELHATISTARLGRTRLPDRVNNHGVLDEDGWSSLLGSVRFVLGLGDPVAGPTVYEALAHGCVVIIPAFVPARRLGHNKDVSWTSQHPWAEAIGPPYVYTVDLGDEASLLETLKTVHSQPPPKPWFPPEYTRESVLRLMEVHFKNESLCHH